MHRRLRSFFSINPMSITAALTLLNLFLFAFGVPILEIVELKTFDLRLTSRGAKKPSSEVVLAVIDEKSLKEEGRWPWPRAKIAGLVEALSEDGAKVIAFDILFAEPDENSHLKFIDRLDRQMNALGVDNDRFKAFVEQSRQEADNDLALVKAIEASRAKVVLGHFFHMTQADLNYRADPQEIEDRLARINHSKYPVILRSQSDLPSDPFIYAYAPQTNLAALSRVASSSGYFNMLPDRDGVVRWIPLALKCGREVFSPLSVQSVWHYLDQPRLMLKVAAYGTEGVLLGKNFIPTDEYGQMLINYLGPEKTFTHYAITDILRGNLPKGTFKGKIVLVGATAIGIYDLRNTPFSAVYPGLEIHATVIDNILQNDFLQKPKWAKIYGALAIIVLSLLIAFVVPRIGAVKGMLFASGLFVLYLLGCQWLFTHASLWIELVYPLLTIVLLYTCLTVYHYLSEERERKKIRRAFVHYVSSSVANEMLKDPAKLKLGGDKRDLTVLFSDIRGFTTISESLTPEDLVSLLNEYLTVMTDVVFKYGGTLDKYMGDAIMAVYGAPLEQPDHPFRACHTALEMMESLKRLNEKWVQERRPPLDIGIGINTGMMMVGNMGSEQRFDYTVMGDAVNLGSRLEGANKTYLTHILLSEFTYERVKDEFVCMELDRVKVQGKTLPVKIYQLLGRNDLSADAKEAVHTFHRGLKLYNEQRWDEATAVFQALASEQKHMHEAALYIKRSSELKSNPPPSDWDGVFTMKTK